MQGATYFQQLVAKAQDILANFSKTEKQIADDAKNTLDEAIKKGDNAKIQIIKNKISNLK